MRVRIAGVLSCAVLAACGSAAEHAAPPPPAFDVTAPAVATGPPIGDPAALRAKLLTTAELPSGFTVLPDPEDDLGLPPAPGGSGKASTQPPACAAVLEPVGAQHPGALAQAVRRFEGPDFASVDIDAASYSANSAAVAFSRVRDVLRGCLSYHGTDADGTGVRHRISGLEQPPAGDASLAVRLFSDSDGLSLTSDIVVFVVGATVVQLTASAPTPIEPAVLTDLVEAQAERLRT